MALHVIEIYDVWSFLSRPKQDSDAYILGIVFMKLTDFDQTSP